MDGPGKLVTTKKTVLEDKIISPEGASEAVNNRNNGAGGARDTVNNRRNNAGGGAERLEGRGRLVTEGGTVLEKPGTLTTGTTVLQGPMMLLTTGVTVLSGREDCFFLFPCIMESQLKLLMHSAICDFVKK